ncbi:MAG: hypothetical protein AAB642_00445 [Patescibacteria group bacterium]
MTGKSYIQISGAIFLAIAVLHLARLIYRWPANIGSWDVPMWLSWLALVIAGYLAYYGLTLGKR